MGFGERAGRGAEEKEEGGRRAGVEVQGGGVTGGRRWRKREA